jgi:hypothetical protein
MLSLVARRRLVHTTLLHKMMDDLPCYHNLTDLGRVSILYYTLVKRENIASIKRIPQKTQRMHP